MDTVRVALAGNPNTGKTTIFNALTGTRQATGNWAGVTVERKEGWYLSGGRRFSVLDLPGSYALDSASQDERITATALLMEPLDVIVVVADAANIERNLCLVPIIADLGVPVVVALNMMDVARAAGTEIDTGKLRRLLGVRIVETVAHRGEGIGELRAAVAAAAAGPPPPPISYGEETEREIGAIAASAERLGLPRGPRFVAVRLLEQDPAVGRLVAGRAGGPEILAAASRARAAIPSVETFFPEKRYGFIHGLMRESIRTADRLEERFRTTDRLDRLLTGPVLGLPLFFALMWTVFHAVFHWSEPFHRVGERFFNLLAAGATALPGALGAPAWAVSMLANGIIPGVGSVLVFFPNIFILFFLFAILEDSGYMARAAFVMDGFMHRMGLHGKAAIPMILGFGCNVTGIMAARTMESDRDRILAVLVNPFMSCSARLPVYILFTGVFFPRHRGAVVFALYVAGVAAAVLTANVFRILFFREESVPFIMELPPYHAPSPRTALLSGWHRSLHFVRKAGTVILAAVVVIWALSYFPDPEHYAGENSLLGLIGRAIAPVFRPAGFGFWQAAVALLSGIVAKETVIGTLGAICGSPEALRMALPGLFSPLSALSFMVMTLLYVPCMPTIAVMSQEAGARWAALATAWSLVFGWAAAAAVYQTARLLFP